MNITSLRNELRGALKSHEVSVGAPYRDWRLIVFGFALTLLTLGGLTLGTFMGFGQSTPSTIVKQNPFLSEEKFSTVLEMIKKKDEAFQGIKNNGFVVVDPSR